MKTTEIEELLARYYQGTATEEEERALRRALAGSGDLPPHLMEEKAFFAQLDACAAADDLPEVPGELEGKLIRLIDGRARVVRLRWIGGIAAGLLVLFTVGSHFYRPTPQDTCATPAEAYAQAQRALTAFSVTLNKGVKGVAEARQATDKARQDVMEQLSRINNIKE
ncbi:MAG: hypothetical protein LBN29_05100 [Mediterranea sp.]|jgi:hypothetical protein|nr:hypothetical protein [Mediterranea sp.]